MKDQIMATLMLNANESLDDIVIINDKRIILNLYDIDVIIKQKSPHGEVILKGPFQQLNKYTYGKLALS